MLTRHLPRAAATSLLLAIVLTGCTVPGHSSPGGPSATSDELVLADAAAPGGYNPIAGYGELGVSPLYDGLLGPHSTGDDHLPTLEPRLASAMPRHSADLLTWTVPLRQGVTFHDGSSFDAADVVATYRAVLDPASASEVASTVSMIRSVAASKDGRSVVFTLKHPYADFPSRLTLGIAPSQKLTGGEVGASSLNRQPVGTGPYRLQELTADKAVFVANPDYWRGAPQVERLTTIHVPDDNARVQRVASGEFDGGTVPPALAAGAAGKGTSLRTAQSADWRGVSLPEDSRLAADPVARLAMNLAVDRQAMVRTVLAGHGSPAATPIAPVHTAAHDPKAAFSHDVARANTLLDGAGWARGDDGIRAKGGERASFTVAYTPTDTVRRDLATAFAADMRTIGIEVKLEGLGFEQIEPQVKRLGIMLGGGERPYSLDTQTYETLHTHIDGTSVWANPGNHGTSRRDALLERGRRTADATEQAAVYRGLQRDYVADPSHVFLVFLEHTYVAREDGWKQGPMVVEPHAHGVGWGPWWNLREWTR